MPTVVLARKDDTMQFILFADSDSAKNFVDFAKLYMAESGACNGYGAYWVFGGYNAMFDAPETIPEGSDPLTTNLEWDRIEFMIKSIAQARSGGDAVLRRPQTEYGTRDGRIVFSLKGFANPQKPKKGDMYRIVDWSKILGEYGSVPGEGRVLSVNKGGSIIAIDCNAEDDEGHLIEGTERFTIPLTAVMKIPDWMTAHREYRKANTK